MTQKSQHPLLAALGGLLGIAEAVVPPFLFVVLLTISSLNNAGQIQAGVPWLAIIISGAASIGFIIARVIRREGVTQAVAGLVAVLASLLLTALTNRAENNFLIGLLTNAAYAVAFTISIFVRWPLVGILVGILTKTGNAWRKNRDQRRVMNWLTLLWVAMFVVRVCIELPLYLTSNLAGLGIAKLVLGLPLYAPILLVTWLIVRGLTIEYADEATQVEDPARPTQSSDIS